MNSCRKFREIGSWRTCTWPAQTTKMCRTQSSCKNSYTLLQGLSRNFVRIFVLQNLSSEPFFSNMTATETATEKVRYMYCTFLQVLQVLPRVRGVMYSWYYKQIADRNSCFGGTKLYLGQCNLGSTHSNSPDSSKQMQSYKYEIFTRRHCTHWLVSYEANKLLNLSTMEIFPDMRIYLANSVNESLNLSLQIGNYQR